MVRHGLVEFWCCSGNGSARSFNIPLHATLLRLMCLSDLYTIHCVMEEPERFARLNPNAELIVDLRRVGHISVEILSDLLWLKNCLERCGGILRLRGVGNEVQELLQLTGMATIFEVAEEARTEPDSTDHSTHLLHFSKGVSPHETSHDKCVHGPRSGGL